MRDIEQRIYDLFIETEEQQNVDMKFLEDTLVRFAKIISDNVEQNIPNNNNINPKEIIDLKSKLNQTTSKLQDTYNQLDKANKKVEQEKQQIVKLMVELQESTEKLKEDTSIISELEQARKQNEQKINYLEQQNSSLNSYISSSNTEIDEHIKHIENLNHKVKELKQERDSIYLQYEEQVEKSNKYHKTHKKLDKLYSQYSNLSLDAKSSIISIYKLDLSLEQFLLSIGDYERLKMFWSYVASLYVNKKSSADELKDLFENIFDLYSNANSHIIRLEVDLDKGFQEEEQICIGQAIGKITEVKFRGIKDTKTNQILQKSIVKS